MREGTLVRRIGYVNLITGFERSNVMPDMSGIIRKWGLAQNLDAVVWTDLPSNFEKETKKDFSVDSAIQYLEEELSKEKNQDGFDAAYEYFSKAPKEVITPLREKLENHSWYQKGKS